MAAALLVGCQSIPRIEKGPLIGHGEANGEPRYTSLSIDLERRPDQPLPLFCVGLSPSADPIASDRLTVEYVRRHLEPFPPPRYWPETWKKRAAEYESFQGSGYFISFRAGRLTSIGLGMREQDSVIPETRPTTPARVGPPDCSTLYSLPITRTQFVEIFGPPDREFSVSEIYY